LKSNTTFGLTNLDKVSVSFLTKTTGRDTSFLTWYPFPAPFLGKGVKRKGGPRHKFSNKNVEKEGRATTQVFLRKTFGKVPENFVSLGKPLEKVGKPSFSLYLFKDIVSFPFHPFSQKRGRDRLRYQQSFFYKVVVFQNIFLLAHPLETSKGLYIYPLIL